MSSPFDAIDRALEAIKRELLPYWTDLPLTVTVGSVVMSGGLIDEDQFLESIDPLNLLERKSRSSARASLPSHIVINEYLHLHEVTVIAEGGFTYVAPAKRIRKRDITSWSIGQIASQRPEEAAVRRDDE
jgi:hypothetical protein